MLNSTTDYKDWISSLVRTDLRHLVPYSSARSENPSDAQASPLIHLDANEWGGEDGLIGFERYPDPQPKPLRSAYAHYLNVKNDSLFIGRGADEAIDVIIRLFCEAGKDAILTTPPTYGYYEVAAAIQGAIRVQAPLQGSSFSLDEELIYKTSSTGVKLVFICSPNNPTGHAFAPETLLSMAKKLEGQAILVVDEAYIEFSNTKSLAQYARDLPNLIVLRTLSKALGHAGVRIGGAVAHPEIISWMQRVRAPYPLSQPQIDVAMKALQICSGERMARRKLYMSEERNRISSILKDISIIEKIWPSDANFLLIQVKDPQLILNEMKKNGILIRDRSLEPRLTRCIRVSIGSRQENDALISVFLKNARRR